MNNKGNASQMHYWFALSSDYVSEKLIYWIIIYMFQRLFTSYDLFFFFIVATFCNVYLNFTYCRGFAANPTLAGLVCFADSDNCSLSLNRLQLI